MIMMERVQVTHVAEYFEDVALTLSAFFKGHNLLMGDDIKMGFVNCVISKDQAIEFAKNVYKERNKDFSELWISVDALRAKEVIDYLGKPVFDALDPDLSGWLVFYNPSTYINWEHECEYSFIVGVNNFECKKYLRGPDEEIKLQMI